VFKEYVGKVAEYILDNAPASVEDVVAAMQSVTNEYVMKMGEKLSIRRYTVYEANDTVVDTYIHMGGKIGVMVEASKGASSEVVHDVALQIAAANSQYVTRDEVPQAEVEHEKEILKAQAMNEDSKKPEAIIEKMLVGRINKFYKEVCLTEQVFVKNPDITMLNTSNKTATSPSFVSPVMQWAKVSKREKTISSARLWLKHTSTNNQLEKRNELLIPFF